MDFLSIKFDTLSRAVYLIMSSRQIQGLQRRVLSIDFGEHTATCLGRGLFSGIIPMLVFVHTVGVN
jgi:hypothetical protein